MVLVYADWQDDYWSPLLRLISVARVDIKSGQPVYHWDGSKKPLPPPLWNTQVSLVDTKQREISPTLLNPKLVKWLGKLSLNWGFEDLQREMTKYPKKTLVTSEQEIQTVPSNVSPQNSLGGDKEVSQVDFP